MGFGSPLAIHTLAPTVHRPMNPATDTPCTGTIAAVRGSVVDLRFDGRLPPMLAVLRAGAQREIVIEVLAQRDEHPVRDIALTPTEGPTRGMPVLDTGAPLGAPVGPGIVSRLLDVFGQPIDRGAALAAGPWRSVHRAPPRLDQRSPKCERFETGTKVIDVLSPLERGG